MMENKPPREPCLQVATGACEHPELATTLYGLFDEIERQNGRLAAELSKLEGLYQDLVYTELIHLLCHLRLEPADAKRHWRKLVEHQQSMERRLGHAVDLRVAVASYFVELNYLRNPKIIEMSVFEETCASAYVDGLTGLRNYRFFSQYLLQEILRCDQYGSPVSLVMLDVDDFKSYNDRHGHEAGNQALAGVADLLRESLRRVDVAARFGGEEFALILPSTPKIAAHRVAERARDTIEGHPFFPDDEEDRLTVSVGVATYPADAHGPEELLQHADSAMYLAKSEGKNQVRLYGQSLRTYRRIPASLKGRFASSGSEYRPLTTLSVSEGGMLFRTDRSVPAGALVDTRIVLPDSSREIAFSGQVIHDQPRQDGQFETTVRIIDIAANDRWHLVECIRGLDGSRSGLRKIS